jgi:hypothetical protein
MSINSTNWGDDMPSTQSKAEAKSDAPDVAESLGRPSETEDAKVIGLVEVEQHGPESEATAADAGSVASGAPLWTALLRSSALPVVVGGLSGAIVAIAAVFVMAELRPPMDPRVEPLAQQIGGFTQRMQSQESSLRAVEIDLVRTLNQQADVSAEVVKQNTAIEMALGQVAAVSEQIRADNGPGSSVFGVAVVQLADSIAHGRPFEAEWVNLFGLTVDESELQDTLQSLLPFARSGVDTVAGLRLWLRDGASRVDLAIARPDSILWVAADYLQTQLGLPLGTTPAEQAAEAMLTEADRRLADGNVEGAIEIIADLGLPFADSFTAWLEAAHRRDLADKVAAELTTVARREISERARRRASAQSGNGLVIGLQAVPLKVIE